MKQKGPKLKLPQSTRSAMRSSLTRSAQNAAEGPIQPGSIKRPLTLAKQKARQIGNVKGYVMPSSAEYRKPGEKRFATGGTYTTKGKPKNKAR